MSHAPLRPFYVLLLSTSFSLSASADPCAATLGKVDPGGAAAVTADESQARQDIDDLEEHVESDDADAQWKRKDAGRILKRAAQHHSFETPFYAQGIGKAMEKGDIKSATTLTECVSRRSQQSSLDNAFGERNEEAGRRATLEDALSGSLVRYEPPVIQVPETPPAAEPVSAPAPQPLNIYTSNEVVRLNNDIPLLPQ